MADFQAAYNVLAQNEDGYANVSGDVGGETYRGISRVYHPDWSGWAWIDNYKASNGSISRGTIFPQLEGAVQEFVRNNYWIPIDGDEIQNQQIANMVLDFDYQSGRAAQVINQAIGLPATNSITSDTINVINSGNPTDVFNEIKQARLNYYQQLNNEGLISNNLIQGVLARVMRLASPQAIGIAVGAIAVVSTLFFF